ncbi:MAG: ABC transporter ATP-binding protein [Candidatus Fimenecus sp.]
MHTSPDEVVLRAEGISKSFGDNHVLQNVDFTLKKGELVCLLGISGGGKTTLFNILSGLMQPDSGKVYLGEREITGRPGEISYMLQKDLLLPYRTVVDNVALPLIIKGMSKKEAREKASSYFGQFGIDGTQKKYPNKLSGGMRQRAALLRTYLASDGVALLDEPFSALDTITKSAMHEWYLDIMNEIDLTTLFITHDTDEAVKLSDRICILGGKPGHILCEIPIDVPRPRPHDFSLTPEFLNYKRQIAENLIL